MVYDNYLKYYLHKYLQYKDVQSTVHSSWWTRWTGNGDPQNQGTGVRGWRSLGGTIISSPCERPRLHRCAKPLLSWKKGLPGLPGLPWSRLSFQIKVQSCQRIGWSSACCRLIHAWNWLDHIGSHYLWSSWSGTPCSTHPTSGTCPYKPSANISRCHPREGFVFDQLWMARHQDELGGQALLWCHSCYSRFCCCCLLLSTLDWSQ